MEGHEREGEKRKTNQMRPEGQVPRVLQLQKPLPKRILKGAATN